MMNVNELDGAVVMEPRAPVNNSASIVTMIEQARMENRLVIENRRNESVAMTQRVSDRGSFYASQVLACAALSRERVEAPELLDFEDFEQVMQEIDQVADDAQQEAVNGNILLAIGLATLMYRLVEPGLASFEENRNRVDNYSAAVTVEVRNIKRKLGVHLRSMHATLRNHEVNSQRRALALAALYSEETAV